MRDKTRPPDHVSVSHGNELANTMLANPATYGLVRAASKLRGFLDRQEHIAVEFVRTLVEKCRKLAQLGGNDGAVFDRSRLDTSDI
jgi:hypothetical protein